MKEFFEIGDFLQGSYPEVNVEGYRTRGRSIRTFQLQEIRDLNIAPLEEQTLLATPLTCRSDILLTGVCLDSGKTKSFYLGSFEGLKKIEVGDYAPPPPQVLVLSKEGGLIDTEDFSDADRAVFCEYFNSRSETCIAVPKG